MTTNNIAFSVCVCHKTNTYFSYRTDGTITYDGEIAPKAIHIKDWQERLEYVRLRYGLKNIPENLKKKEFSSNGRHTVVWFTSWGNSVPEGAVCTFDGDKQRRKAYILE